MFLGDKLGDNLCMPESMMLIKAKMNGIPLSCSGKRLLVLISANGLNEILPENLPRV